MIPILGIACVAWTAYEITRLVQRASRPVLGAEGTSAEARRPRRRRRFAAWDDRGRPIDVEDLGPA